jgi:hypothetical protein
MTTTRVRTTISLDQEVLQVFQEFADLSGVSVSRAMGDWLAETVEGVRFVHAQVLKAKRAPAEVMRSVHQLSASEMAADPRSAAAVALAQFTSAQAVARSRASGVEGSPPRGEGPRRSSPKVPPSSLTGVKDLPKRRSAP